MGYYIRILARNNERLDAKDISGYLSYLKLNANLTIESGTSEHWDSLLITYPDDEPICVIERNAVVPGSLGYEEIQEFTEDVHHYKPVSSAIWLESYFREVKVIYAIQVLSGTNRRHGWDILGAVKDLIWSRLGGILQADNEGFSNEDGYHILWQFDEHVSGEWNMAILNEQGEWQKFKMDLGNSVHRDHFLEGKIPPKVKIIA